MLEKEGERGREGGGGRGRKGGREGKGMGEARIGRMREYTLDVSMMI